MALFHAILLPFKFYTDSRDTVPLHIDVECSTPYTVYWEVQPELSTYTGDYALRCFEPSQQATYFTIPQDAKLHDSFIVLCTV